MDLEARTAGSVFIMEKATAIVDGGQKWTGEWEAVIVADASRCRFSGDKTRQSGASAIDKAGLFKKLFRIFLFISLLKQTAMDEEKNHQNSLQSVLTDCKNYILP